MMCNGWAFLEALCKAGSSEMDVIMVIGGVEEEAALHWN
jgi:hypothetical protein